MNTRFISIEVGFYLYIIIYLLVLWCTHICMTHRWIVHIYTIYDQNINKLKWFLRLNVSKHFIKIFRRYSIGGVSIQFFVLWIRLSEIWFFTKDKTYNKLTMNSFVVHRNSNQNSTVDTIGLTAGGYVWTNCLCKLQTERVILWISRVKNNLTF